MRSFGGSRSSKAGVARGIVVAALVAVATAVVPVQAARRAGADTVRLLPVYGTVFHPTAAEYVDITATVRIVTVSGVPRTRTVGALTATIQDVAARGQSSGRGYLFAGGTLLPFVSDGPPYLVTRFDAQLIPGNPVRPGDVGIPGNPIAPVSVVLEVGLDENQAIWWAAAGIGGVVT